MWGLGGELFGRNFGKFPGASGGALVANFSGGIVRKYSGASGGALVANFSEGIVRKYSGASEEVFRWL